MCVCVCMKKIRIVAISVTVLAFIPLFEKEDYHLARMGLLKTLDFRSNFGNS